MERGYQPTARGGGGWGGYPAGRLRTEGQPERERGVQAGERREGARQREGGEVLGRAGEGRCQAEGRRGSARQGRG